MKRKNAPQTCDCGRCRMNKLVEELNVVSQRVEAVRNLWVFTPDHEARFQAIGDHIEAVQGETDADATADHLNAAAGRPRTGVPAGLMEKVSALLADMTAFLTEVEGLASQPAVKAEGEKRSKRLKSVRLRGRELMLREERAGLNREDIPPAAWVGVEQALQALEKPCEAMAKMFTWSEATVGWLERATADLERALVAIGY